MSGLGYQNPANYTPQVPFYENWHRGGFIVSQSAGGGLRSFEQVLITGGVKLLAGTVLGYQGDTAGSVAVSATAGNTGNGVVTPDAVTPVEPGAISGIYSAVMNSATTFTVFDPNGKEVGVGKTGVAFNNQVKFTLAVGATPFAVDDSIAIAVAAGTGKYVQLNPAAADGSENAAAILLGVTDVTLVDKKAAVMVRDGEFNLGEILWPAGITAPQMATALAQLATNHLIARS